MMKRFGAMALVALVFASCAAGRVEQRARPTALLEVQRLVLMPITDLRGEAERFESVGVERHVRDAARKVLGKKGYAVLPRDLFEEGDDKTERGSALSLDDKTPAQLAALGPEGAETLLFIGVREVSQRYDGGGDAYRIVLSGVVVDKATERIIWRSTGVGTSNFGGLFRAVAPLQGQYDAAYEALVEMFSSVPNRKV